MWEYLLLDGLRRAREDADEAPVQRQSPFLPS